MDGSARQKLCDGELEYVNIVGDWIYFDIENENCKPSKMKIDGSNRQTINGLAVRCINVVGEWIYFQNGCDDSKLYKMHTDGSKLQKLSDISSYRLELNVVGDWIYYTGEPYGLYKIRIDGTEEQLLDDSNVEYINVAGEWIYYNVFEDGIYKMKVDGSNKQKLSNDYADAINIAGDWIYYSTWSMDEDYNFKTEGQYKIKTDGTCKIDRITNNDITREAQAKYVEYCYQQIYSNNITSEISHKDDKKIKQLMNSSISNSQKIQDELYNMNKEITEQNLGRILDENRVKDIDKINETEEKINNIVNILKTHETSINKIIYNQSKMEKEISFESQENTVDFIKELNQATNNIKKTSLNYFTVKNKSMNKSKDILEFLKKNHEDYFFKSGKIYFKTYSNMEKYNIVVTICINLRI